MYEDKYSFDLNPDMAWAIVHIGQDKTPVITIENVLKKPSFLVDYAAIEVSFDLEDDVIGGYPGIRAAAPLNYVESLVKAVDPLIRDVFGLQNVNLAGAECSFCIVTTPRKALHPLQCIPHIDTTYPLQFAILHYLCPESFGGTAMFRQTATGIETVTEAVAEAYQRARDAVLISDPPQKDYVKIDDPHYSQIASFQAAFDRVIIYPSNLLHSGVITEAEPFDHSPRGGRLTSNIFVTYAQKKGAGITRRPV
jgi:hypothetical protein